VVGEVSSLARRRSFFDPLERAASQIRPHAITRLPSSPRFSAEEPKPLGGSALARHWRVLACLRTAAVFGIDACAVRVEVDVTFGLPSFTMVGLPDAGVRESRDRIRTAIRNSGFDFPPHRITINLAPADIRKVGSAFDLPIALGVLAASGVLVRRQVDDVVLLGELSLDGGIQPTRGALPVAVAARREGVPAILLPTANACEAAVVEPLDVIAVDSLAQAVDALNDPAAARARPRIFPAHRAAAPRCPDFADVRGQGLARRALEVAAAGAHNILLVGPPGAGKTLMARRLPGILPPLAFEEALESSAIHSVCGLLPAGVGLLVERPFRAPHHTISDVALVGGGSSPHPGEISLAHNGVLFLDEMLEFDRHVLEVLRQPLEEGRVTVARAARTATFPARFMLVAAMNPCPCGFRGDPVKICRCTPGEIERYRGRLSGPLRDRLDLVVHVPALPAEALSEDGPGEGSSSIRSRVLDARDRQAARRDQTGVIVNAQLQGRAAWRHAHLEREARQLLEQAVRQIGLSARGFDRVLKVARTVADLAGAHGVSTEHMAEALQYRVEV
jgi:magnesium chelatase family protein